METVRKNSRGVVPKMVVRTVSPDVKVHSLEVLKVKYSTEHINQGNSYEKLDGGVENVSTLLDTGITIQDIPL